MSREFLKQLLFVLLTMIMFFVTLDLLLATIEPCYTTPILWGLTIQHHVAISSVTICVGVACFFIKLIWGMQMRRLRLALQAFFVGWTLLGLGLWSMVPCGEVASMYLLISLLTKFTTSLYA